MYKDLRGFIARVFCLWTRIVTRKKGRKIKSVNLSHVRFANF